MPGFFARFWPVDGAFVAFFGSFVAGDDGVAGTMVAVGDGDSSICRSSHGGGYSGDDFKGNCGGGEFLRFFTATAKDERITTL